MKSSITDQSIHGQPSARAGSDRVRLGDLDAKDVSRSLSCNLSSMGPCQTRRSPGFWLRTCDARVQVKAASKLQKPREKAGRKVSSTSGKKRASGKYAAASARKAVKEIGAVKRSSTDRKSVEASTEARREWPCSCGRAFQTERGMKIHRTKMGCSARQANCSAPAARKSGEAPALVANQSGGHVTTRLPRQEQLLEETTETVQPIKWPKMKEYEKWQELDQLAGDRLEILLGGLARRATAFSEKLYEACLECFGPATTVAATPVQRHNHRQIRKKLLRQQLRSLQRKRADCSPSEHSGLDELIKDLRAQIAKLARAEACRLNRQARRRNLARFVKDPYAYSRRLFEASKSGELNAPKEEVEQHLRLTYGGSKAAASIGEFPGNTRPTPPGCAFYDGSITEAEVEEAVSKARAKVLRE